MEGGVNTPLKQLTPINELDWLLTETQLAKLHQEFKNNQSSSLEYRLLNLAEEMKIKHEVVQKWYEHNRDKSVKRCECDYVQMYVYIYVHMNGVCV